MQAEQRDFRRRRFKSPARPDRAWIAWFREEYSRRMYDLDVEPLGEGPFTVEGTVRELPDLAISPSFSSPKRSVHHGSLGGDDELSIALPLAGALSLRIEGDEHQLSPGMGGLRRHGVRAEFEARANVRLLSIRLRRRLLQPLVRNFAHLPGYTPFRNPAAVALLRGYIGALEAQDAIHSSETSRLVALHVHDLAALALGPSRDAQDVVEGRGKRAARLAAVKTHIRSELANPQLSVSMVAAHQGVTSRYVHLMFEAEGSTFSEYVVGQRLADAHRMLADRRFANQSIASIALAAGFGDVSYFNRTFRRRFGDTPSAIRAALASAHVADSWAGDVIPN